MTTTAATPDEASTRRPTGTDRAVGDGLAWAALALVVVARGYRAFVVTLVVAASVPALWSWSSYVVRSGSMEPALRVGDVVVGKPHPSDQPVPVGRIMVLDNPDTSSAHPVLVHRVVESLGDGLFTTAGDANRSDDTTPVSVAGIRERAVLRVPFVALPLTWLDAHHLVPLLLWALATALAFYFASRPPDDPRHKARKERREAGRARRVARAAGTVVRRGAVPIGAAAALVVAAVWGVVPLRADAAFTATTTSPRSSWTAATTLDRDVTLVDPGSVVRGTVPLTVTLANITTAPTSVRVEYATAGTTTWRTLCTDTTAPYTCSWATATFSSQDYDLRAVSVTGSTTRTSDVVADVQVDNVAPVVTMQNPGTPLRGTVRLAADVTDVHSGVDDVVMQYALTGSTTWKDACSVTDAPYGCTFDTTTAPGGSYSFRAVARDVAGNATTSATIASRMIDNTVSSVSMNDPDTFLTGTVTLSASAASTSGVGSVRIQRAVSGSSTWTDVCTDTTSPYTCSWDTTQVAAGLYDLRAVLVDGAGRTTTSAVVAGRRVDNSPLLAHDVQTANGGAIAGRVDAGDSITFTYSQEVRLSSISTGWTGAPMSVTMRLRDGNLLALGSSNDSVDIQRDGATLALGSLNLRQNYIGFLGTAQFAATMSASRTTVNGISATRIVIVLGSQTSGPSLPTTATTSAMIWSSSSAVTDLIGRAASTTPATESGTADREF
jgi:signal peptidase I